MIKSIRIFSIAILILLGIGAVYGGVTLIIDPTGELLGLPLEVLDLSPFSNYLIPGIILLIMIGLLPFYITYSTIRKLPKYDWMIIAQGILLIIWLTTEIIMGIFEPFIHYTYYTIGILLVLCGIMLIKKKDSHKTTYK